MVDALLAPYRVLDLTDEKGSFCGKTLADLGADVIKIEKPGGDPSRNLGPFYRNISDPERSLHWFALNANKRSITLNLELVDGKEIFKGLVKTADLVVESFTPGYLEGLGLGYSSLKRIRPSIIIVSISPFGQVGPYRMFKASDMVLMAMGGLMFTTGDPDRPPVRVSVPQAYFFGGIHAAVGALIAVQYRNLTQEGQHVDVSIQEAVGRLLHLEPLFWAFEKNIIHRTGSFHTRGGPQLHQIFDCKDGQIAFRMLYGGGHWRLMLPLIEWMKEEGMAGKLEKVDWSNVDLHTHPDLSDLQDIFAQFFLRHSKKEFLDQLEKRNIPILPVLTPAELLEDDHLRERHFWVSVEHPELGEKLIYPGAPYKFSEIECRSKRAPLIGEHNSEIYEELNLSASDLARLKERGVI